MNTPKKMKQLGLAAISLLALSPLALAHKAWLLPSQTVLSDEGGWITVDGAVSNDLFYFNHNPMRIDNLTIRAPDGAVLPPQNVGRGKYRTTFDVQLQQKGTYRLAIQNDNVNARWDQAGEQKRWRGNAAALAKEVPADAKNLEVTHTQSRIETFVTVGKPSDVSQVQGTGLELVPVTHPNDLYAGEAATLRFLLDGKPAANVAVEIVEGGSRYRDAQGEVKLTTDAKGEIKVTWPEAGMYCSSPIPQAKTRNATYVGTFEVLTQ
jgi:uncharacterized GH25 family protein